MSELKVYTGIAWQWATNLNVATHGSMSYFQIILIEYKLMALFLKLQVLPARFPKGQFWVL